MPQKPKVTGAERYAIYFPQPKGEDAVALAKMLGTLSESRRGSEVLRILALRGWAHLLHCVPLEERAMQLRLLDLPEELIGEINTIVPKPHLLPGSMPAQAAPVAPARAVPAVAAERPVVVEPAVKPPPPPPPSRIGNVTAYGGLS